MTDYKISGQSSSAAGTALDATSAAGTASPIVPNLITPGVGGTITYEANTAGVGTKAIRVTPAAATSGFWGWTGMTTDVANPNKITIRGFWTAPSSIPTTGQGILRIASSGGGTNLADIGLTGTTGFFSVTNLGTGSATVAGTFPMVGSTTYDLEVQLENPTTTTGFCTVIVRSLAGATLSTVTKTASDFGTSSPATVRFGKTSSAGNLGATDWKYITVRTGASSGLTTPGANNPPTVPAIAAQIQGGGSSTFTAVPTDSDGTIVSHAWVVKNPDGSTLGTGITGASTTAVTITHRTITGTYTLTYTATDNDGGQTSVTTYLYVPVASGVPARPDRVVSNAGSWAPGGDAATLIAALQDTDGSGFVLSPDSPTGNSLVVHMAVPGPGHYTVAMYIGWIDSTTGTTATGVTGTISARVYQGTTPVTAEHFFTNDIGTPIQVSFDFTTGEDSTLTADLSDIRIEIKAVQ